MFILTGCWDLSIDLGTESALRCQLTDSTDQDIAVTMSAIGEDHGSREPEHFDQWGYSSYLLHIIT